MIAFIPMRAPFLSIAETGFTSGFDIKIPDGI
ncbi:hypothetical protein P792_02750 [Asaia sp. SF2.1]|nr:hypothetical protein P792_02750 [Asaia sp. SF2.1]